MSNVQNAQNLVGIDEGTTSPDMQTAVHTVSPVTTEKVQLDIKVSSEVWKELYTLFPDLLTSLPSLQEFHPGPGLASTLLVTKSKPTSPTPKKKKGTISSTVVIGKVGR